MALINFKTSFSSNILTLGNTEEDCVGLSEQQRIWAKCYALKLETFSSANSSKDLIEEFAALPLSPCPEIYSLYSRENTQKDFKLVRDPCYFYYKLWSNYRKFCELSLVMLTALATKETLYHTKNNIFLESV